MWRGRICGVMGRRWGIERTVLRFGAIVAVGSAAEVRAMTRNCLLIGLLGVALCGCADDRGAQRSAAMIEVEVLGFDGCPNTPVMQERVAEAVLALGEGYRVVEVDQEALEESDARRGYPTPTVLVNGADLFGMPMPDVAAMGCRVYPGGLPTAAEIGRRLAEWDR